MDNQFSARICCMHLSGTHSNGLRPRLPGFCKNEMGSCQPKPSHFTQPVTGARQSESVMLHVAGCWSQYRPSCTDFTSELLIILNYSKNVHIGLYWTCILRHIHINVIFPWSVDLIHFYSRRISIDLFPFILGGI